MKYIGTETLNNQGKDLPTTILEFWSWAYSDILGNTERGVFAEFIVACALDNLPKQSGRIGWASYDLDYNGLKIEVKSSAYIQSWKQQAPSKIIFNIPKTLGWDASTNEYDTVKKRQADIYVFCVLAHRDKDSLNPLMMEQWFFYVISTEALNVLVNDQKTISLTRLIKAGCRKVMFSDLKKEILIVAKSLSRILCF
jgi:hypothetical protein